MTQYCVWTTVMIVDSALIMKMAWLLADHVIRPSYYGNGVARSVVLLVQHQKVANAFKKSLVVLILCTILGSVAPLAVLTGHHTPIVCIAVNCSLGIVASGAMCE